MCRRNDGNLSGFPMGYGEGVNSARGATAILAAAITLVTCLEHPFTRTIANELLHCKERKECNRFWTIANYCVP